MELHAQPTRDFWDVMTFGSGDARAQPIWIVITTAGDDPDRQSIGWEIHEKAQKIISGEMADPRWYCKIYGLEPDFEGDIYDEELWYKINPSLGHTIDIEKVRQAAIGARNNEAEEKLFRWLRLNQWIVLKTIGWLPITLWDETLGKWDSTELVGKKCYAGLDLASTTDLTGLVLLFPPQDGLPDWRFVSEGWIPEEKLKERMKRDKFNYKKAISDKVLFTTPGSATDYDFVEARIINQSKLYNMRYLATDSWNTRMLTQRLDKEGIQTIEIAQSMTGMSPGMKQIERLMLRGELSHEPNILGRWCFGNTRIATDGNENIKPMKNKSTGRIDLTVALIDAMSVAIRFEQTCIYDNRPEGEKIFAI